MTDTAAPGSSTVMAIYFILFLAFLNGTSEQAARVALSLYALQLGAQPLTIGVLAATFSAFPLLLAVQAGRLADRFGVRWLLMSGGLGAGLTMFAPYFAPGYPAIFSAAAMIGLTDAIFNVALQNLVGTTSNEHNRTRNFNNYSLAASVFSLVGPLLAGFAIDFSGHGKTCLYIALWTLVPVALLAVWGRELRGSAREIPRSQGGIRTLIAEPGVRKVLVTSSLLNTGNHLYQFFVPVYATTIGLSASIIGVVLAVNAAAMFMVRLVLPFLIAKLTVERLLTCAFFAGAASLALIPLFTNPGILVLISFVFGLGMGCAQPLMIMLMFANAPKGRSGEALGLRMTANHFTKIAGPILLGFIASAFGLPLIFWLNALMLGSGGIVTRSGKFR